MKRLYYLTKSMDSTQSISSDLHQAGITDWNFHVLSKQHEGGLYRRHIHSANTSHKTDIIHSAERGAIIGFASGIVLAFFLSVVPVFEAPINTLSFFFVVLLAILIGGWIGGFIGIQTENYKIKRFHDKLEEGYYLIMVDVDVGQEELVHQLMVSKHPEAKFCIDGSSLITPFHHPKSLKF